MKVKLSLAVALLLVCTSAFAQEQKPPAMDPAMMEAMMKAGTPGDAHKNLNALVGSWNTKVTMWMVPGADPMTMDGTSETRWVMGGRYLEERFAGNFMGMPFEGLGYSGYDNVKKQYWGTWMDNMSTGMMMSTGTYDGKAWTFKGTMADPMTGKDSTIDQKVTFADADHHMMEMWGPAPDGKIYKSMEITYSRKK
ncbi:MAG TPA: DUF1579 domain-containing protein [Thermoanaerobaculia bacterium]|jgi:hypothetical protein|nr:DUF1579 domain-containing protein [Thermoanaerobaculia bacterium]